MKRMIDRYFALAGGIGFLMVSVLGGGRVASAQTTVPHTFSADTTARANEVNENFKALADAVDNITTGVQGPMGPQGLPGPKGDTGAQGSAGPAGLNGLNGAPGLQGPKGEKGDPGIQGIQGPAGTNGTDGLNGTDGTNGSPDTADQVREKFVSGTSCTDPNNPNDIMVKVGPLCIDKYEASVWPSADGSGTQLGATTDDYGTGFPDNGNWTTPLYAVSKAGVIPSRSITWFQAQQTCFLNGKRLLTNAEWQAAAAGTPDPGTDDGSTDCAVLSALSDTGSRSKCVSKWGVHDMVGNVWEWVADWMQNNSDVDVGSSSSATYGHDFVVGIDESSPQEDRFPAALFRGGHWSQGSGSGVFALFASNGPSFWNPIIGFRCAR